MARERKTMEQLQADHREAVEANQEIGVIEWKSDLPQSDEVWEVVDGYHHVPAEPARSPRGTKMKTLGPGNRFRPTVQQAKRGDARGGLLRGGKMRRLTATEMAGIGRSQDPSHRPWSPGADIGIRALPMSDTALKLALGTLSEEDFEGTEPEGTNGVYTVRQVERMVEAKQSGQTADSAA